MWIINCIKFYWVYNQFIKANSQGTYSNVEDARYKLDHLRWKLNKGALVSGKDLEWRVVEIFMVVIWVPFVILWGAGSILNKVFIKIRKKIHKIVVTRLMKKHVPSTLVGTDDTLRSIATEINNKHKNK